VVPEDGLTSTFSLLTTEEAWGADSAAVRLADLIGDADVARVAVKKVCRWLEHRG
jgi:hypothetical protein